MILCQVVVAFGTKHNQCVAVAKSIIFGMNPCGTDVFIMNWIQLARPKAVDSPNTVPVNITGGMFYIVLKLFISHPAQM